MGKVIPYSAPFKLETVQELLSGAKRPTQICRERQIDQTTLRRWRQQYEEHGSGAWRERASSAVASEEEKIAELERVIGWLTVENLALKKTVGGAGPACCKRNSGRIRSASREEWPLAYWCVRARKKHGPGVAADLQVVTPFGRSRLVLHSLKAV